MILICSFPVFCAAEETSTEEIDYGYVPDPYERFGTDLSDGTVELSINYDPRCLGYSTTTTSQSPYRLCWLYATIGAAEQYISRNYGSKVDISEAHGAVAYSNSITPDESGENNGYYTSIPNFGGGSAKALQYLSNWNEPIFEDNNPIHWSSMVDEKDYPKDELNVNHAVAISDDFMIAKPTFNLTGTKYLDDSIDTIKYAIKNYGGVITDLYIQQHLIHKDTNNESNLCIIQDAEVEDVDKPNHTIVLVGWDDEYSKYNFDESNRPVNDGAWLVRNSWYNSDENNYFWVSYEHTSLHLPSTKRIAITDMKVADDSEYMLSYDYMSLGKNDIDYNEPVYICNLFNVSDYTIEYDCIDSVMLYLCSTGCQYRIKIVQLDEYNNLPTNLDNIGVLAEGNYVGEGFLNVKLDEPFEFTSNNKCAIIVELIPDNSNSKIEIPYELDTEARIDVNQSFYGFDNDSNSVNWTDCYYNKSLGLDDVPTGNLSIRPILKNSTSQEHYADINPKQIIDNGEDVVVSFDTDCKFSYIRSKNNTVLREGDDERFDYKKCDGYVIIYKDYIESLGGKYTELSLVFTNNVTKTLIINPKSTIESVNIVGDPIVGETLTAECIGVPERDKYDINYQWQISPNGTSWYDITNANSNSYTITPDEYNLYMRVKVISESIFGNVVYPFEKTSDSTACKVVILGDVNLNGVVEINDATLVSKYLAELVTLDERQLLAADGNRDGSVDVHDVRIIQEIAFGM